MAPRAHYLPSRPKATACRSLPAGHQILIVTHKIDKYGRYIADLFYSQTKRPADDVLSHDRYLNEELLRAGLAKHLP